jgi:hypothetical protein
VSTEDGNGRASIPEDRQKTEGSQIAEISKRGAHLKPYQFPPGKSGNPAGRPKQSREFRAKCRELAMKMLDKLTDRLDGKDDGTVGDDGKLVYQPGVGELTRALETVANHGGFLAADKLATVEAAFARVIMTVATAENLSAEVKQKAIEQAAAVHAEAVGESDE